MNKAHRVIVCGNSVALAGIEISLGMADDCEVISHAIPAVTDELRELNPDVVIFELDAMPQELIYTLMRELPRQQDQPPLLLIGIDLETNRAVLWIEQQTVGWNSQDLAQAIRQPGTTISLRGVAKEE